MKKSGKDNKSGSQSLHNRSSGNHGASGPDPMSLLDPVSLFGKISSVMIRRFFIYCDVSTAYWGRDPTSAAAASQLFGSPFVNNLGLLSGGPGNAGNTPGSSTPERFPPSSHGHNSTMATAASQAASLAGLHSASKIL